MTIKKLLGILRDPTGIGPGEKREAYLMAADLIERYIREQEFCRVRQQRRVLDG